MLEQLAPDSRHVIERGCDEQQQDHDDTRIHDQPARPVAKWLAPGRLQSREQYLTAIQHRHRQQVEHGNVHADQRKQVKNALEPAGLRVSVFVM